MKIEDLYNILPAFTCPNGCTACCRRFGVPSQTKIEAARIRQFLRAEGRKTGKARDTTCPYVEPSGCTIYPVRPLICRLYGVSPDYLCQKGVRPLRLLHEDEEAELWHLYREHFF